MRANCTNQQRFHFIIQQVRAGGVHKVRRCRYIDADSPFSELRYHLFACFCDNLGTNASAEGFEGLLIRTLS